MTRICRSQFESDDIREAQVICGADTFNEPAAEPSGDLEREMAGNMDVHHGETQHEALVQDSPPLVQSKVSLRIPAWVSSSYATIRQHPRNIDRRLPIPFTEEKPSLSRLKSMHSTAVGSPEEAEAIPRTAVQG